MRHDPPTPDDERLSRLLSLIDGDIVDVERTHTHLLLSDHKRALLYFGAVHTFEPSHPQYKELHTLYDDFNPTVTLIEGAEPFRTLLSEEQYQREARAILKDSNEALIRKAAEILFTAKLAIEKGSFLFCPEPSLPETVEFLLQRGLSDRDKLFAYLVFGEMWMWYCREKREGFDKALLDTITYVREHTSWEKFDYSPSHLSLIGARLYGEGDLETLVSTFGATVMSPYGDHALSGTARVFGHYRDHVLLRSIISFLDRGERVFVCYGRTHLSRKRRAIKALFDSYQE